MAAYILRLTSLPFCVIILNDEIVFKKVKPFLLQKCIMSVRVLKRPNETFQKG